MKVTIDLTPEQLEALTAFMNLFKEKQQEQEQAEQQRREIRVAKKLPKKSKGGESND